MSRYSSELMIVTNRTTKIDTYYLRVCGVFRRISQAAYDEMYTRADGLSCLSQKTTKTHSRSYRTVTFTQ